MSETTSAQAATETKTSPAETGAPDPSLVDATAPPGETTEAPKPKPEEQISPRLALAIRTERKAQQLREDARRERDSALADIKREREAMARELEAHRAELEMVRKLRDDPDGYARELAERGDPNAQVRRELEELRKWRDESLAEKKKNEEKSKADAERERVAAISNDIFGAMTDKVTPNFARFPEGMRKNAIAKAVASGQFRTVNELASALEEEAEGMIKTLNPSAQAQTQTGTGSGTQAEKPGAKALTNDLSASTSAAPSKPETIEERKARVKADLARAEERRRAEAAKAS